MLLESGEEGQEKQGITRIFLSTIKMITNFFQWLRMITFYDVLDLSKYDLDSDFLAKELIID